MIAVPIGPRRQRFATAASPAYLDQHGRPDHPRALLDHACLRGRFASGGMTAWEFERDGEVVRVEPGGPLIVRAGAATDLAVDAAMAGTGIIHLFEDWLRPHLDSGALEPVLEPWWQLFSGPFLYYPGRRQLPAPLRAPSSTSSTRVVGSPASGLRRAVSIQQTDDRFRARRDGPGTTAKGNQNRASGAVSVEHAILSRLSF
jgi:DNA-binding transcriptional LysR family regulator